ncbi:unnamed protein product, partial [Polarella glacialis]
MKDGGFTATRHLAVDSEPPEARHAAQRIWACGDEMRDTPAGCRWRKLPGSDADVAAVELLREQAAGLGSAPPPFGLRAGVWLFCGGLSLRVLGPPRGEGLIGGTSCRSLAQLRIVKGSAVDSELAGSFEAASGFSADPGRVQGGRGLWLGKKLEGGFLCGADGEEVGFKT